MWADAAMLTLSRLLRNIATFIGLGAIPFATLAAGTVTRGHIGSEALVLDSPTFRNGARMPRSTVYDRNGCMGSDVSPQLRWSGVPHTVRSFALTINDPDAKAPGGWWHWVRFNIPASAHALRAGDRGTGTDGMNSFRRIGYGGPCPPPGGGIHHYHVLVYGLDVSRLPATSRTDGPALTRMVHGHTLAVGNLVGTYSR